MEMKGHNYSYVFNFEQVSSPLESTALQSYNAFVFVERNLNLHNILCNPCDICKFNLKKFRILNILWSEYGWKRIGGQFVPGQVAFTCFSSLVAKHTWRTGIHLLIFYLITWNMNLILRPAFDLRGPLTGWSMFLAMFSIMGAARTLPEFMHTLYTHGFYHSLCIPSFIENDRVSGFWTWMFVLSKVNKLNYIELLILNAYCRFLSLATQYLSFWGNRNWYFCIGTTTSQSLSTAGTHSASTRLQRDGSLSWTSLCTLSCTPTMHSER